MMKYILSSVITGLSFGIMDGIIHANPYAVKLLQCYKPITKKTINIPAGVLIDLLYGFIISGIYLIIMPALPFETAFIKGMLYGLGIWFFRVIMGVVSQWMMFDIPLKTLLYLSIAGLIEMIILGIISGIIIK